MHGTNPIRSQDLTRGDRLQVEGCWHTVQGEGPHVGIPAVFLRLSGCWLACHWCFGWFPRNGRQPFVYMVRGPKKKLGRIRVGDEILTLDSAGHLQPTKVKKVLRRKVDEWVRIKIGGLLYYCTLDHPLFTNRGLVPAKELRVGDEVLHCEPRDVIAWKKLGDRNPMKDASVTARSQAGHDYSAIGKKIAHKIAERKANGSYVTPMMGEAARARLSAARKGAANPNYNPNRHDRNYALLKEQVKAGGYKCERCGKKRRLEVHHRDHDKTNDDPANFEILCHACHSSEHKVGYNFWPNKRRDKKVLHVKNGKRVEYVQYVNRFDKSPSIRPPALSVVNLSCFPHATYLADGIWSKNCDTQFEKGIDTEFSPEEVVQRVREAHGKSHCRLVVLTGGDPLRQNVVPLCEELIDAGYHVQIETAGIKWNPGLDALCVTQPHSLPPAVSVVLSPKTGVVHRMAAVNACAWKYIIDSADVMDPEDGLPNSSTQIAGVACRLARPPVTVPRSRIYLQPCDREDPERNAANEKLVVELAMRYGYRISLQIHKHLGLE